MNLKNLNRTIIILVLSFTFSASCTRLSASERQLRNVKDFYAVEAQAGIDVYVSQGADYSVEVEADEDDIDDIVTDVSGGTLKIYYKRGHRFFSNGKDKVYVRLPELKGLNASGGADIYGEGEFKCEALEIRASGGGDITLAVDADKLDVDCSGGGDVNIKGQAEELYVNASGGGDYKGYDLVTSKADIDCSGGADVYLTVKDEIRGSASGGSDIFYKGDPSIVDVNSSGGSNIHKRD